MRLWPSQCLELLGRDDQDTTQVAGTVGVAALQADVSLLFVGEGCGVAEGEAAVLGVRFGLVAGAILGQAQERTNRFWALGELFEECASLCLTSLLSPRDVIAFAPSEQSSFPCVWRASDQAASERRALSLAF